MEYNFSNLLPESAGYVMVVDDDFSVRSVLSLLLKRAGLKTLTAADAAGALAHVRRDPPALIIMDMNFSGATTGDDGLELLQKVKVLAPDTAVILITAWGSIPLAVEGMRLGASDFITKPWRNDSVLKSVRTALELRATERNSDAGDFDRCGIIGNSPALLAVLDTVRKVARTDAPVLLLGENGTGKELIARAIHANSRRRDKSMVSVNLGGVPASLFESEMFGYVKGAFTGAVDTRAGRFQIADKSTIFLDEIGELELMNQVKLLRVLQERTFEPLGDSNPHKSDFRLVSATNADLHEMVASRSFREDLFYRINLITLRIPPLRERPGDIPLLARHFLDDVAVRNGLPPFRITDNALKFLEYLPYPGNIRELRNLIERAALIHDPDDRVLDRLDFEAFYSNVAETSVSAPMRDNSLLDDMEQAKIVETLRACDGNISRAAAILGITRQALYRRIAKYRL